MNTSAPRTGATLADKYTATSGDVLLSGVQALVRTTLDVRHLDEQRGLNTRAFISGYQGSPLGTVDREVERASSVLDAAGVLFQQGLNEELAATAVGGTQLLDELDKRRHDGVAGFWFGKNPGLDRAADAIRHSNVRGTAPLGGAVAWIGDDPSSKSSTVPSSCEPICRSMFIPVLAPGSVAEVLSFGLHAIAMSRHAGLWTGLKIVADVADASAVITLDGLFDQIPTFPTRPKVPGPVLLPPTNLDAEFDLMTTRLARACEYAEAANLNKITFEPTSPRVAIVAAGMAYQSLLRALSDLGVDREHLERHGIRLVQLGMPWPLEPRLVRRLLDGVKTVLVVEDKLAFIESIVKESLYGLPDAPTVIGKLDAAGRPLLSPRSGLVSDDVIVALRRTLPGLDPGTLDTGSRRPTRLQLLPKRTPTFCSGCPHSVSTRASEDQLVGVGIGCHIMVALEDENKRGQLTGMTQMGGEGTQWLGLAPFTADTHFTTNLGDGTFYHSGSLALRASIAAGANITYKLLFNDAVAMTGGQQPAGRMELPNLTRWLTLEGVGKIVITTAHPKTWRRTKFGGNVTVRHRDDLGAVQKELAAEPGVTVLLHVDRCATEERRLRKRGKVPAPTERIWINERVCEGCGDCGDKSTCLSVLPVDTEFGRKTAIHQSSCNQDMSCLHGDCPSFVRVTPSGKRALPTVPDADLPEPRRRVSSDVLIRMPGIGGTGVVTVSGIMQLAGFLEGRYAAGLEQIGLAQKGGPVLSDVRFSTTPVQGQLRAARGTVDVLIGFDALGAATDSTLDSLKSTAVAVVNRSITPTPQMVQHVDAAPTDWDDVRARIDDVTTASENLYLDASGLAETYFADHMPTNMILLGAAYQHGTVPLTDSKIEAAIRLNGAAVDINVAAFRLGRIAVVRPELLNRDREHTAEIPPQAARLVARTTVPAALRGRVARLTGELIAYQNAAYAETYLSALDDAVSRTAGTDADADTVLTAYAEGLFKLMAYKDEFEVARLHLDSIEKAKLSTEFGEDAKVKIMLHPPVLRALGWRRKIAFGRWAAPVFRTLYALRWMRGHRIDLFGRAHVRRVERQLPGEYRHAATAAFRHLSAGTQPMVLELLEAPAAVRGYEGIKLANIEQYRAQTAQILRQLGDSSRSAVAPSS